MNRGKSSPKICVTSALKNCPKLTSEQSPNRRKIAQSGHPAYQASSIFDILRRCDVLPNVKMSTSKVLTSLPQDVTY
jgi:hypothetical protein